MINHIEKVKKGSLIIIGVSLILGILTDNLFFGLLAMYGIAVLIFSSGLMYLKRKEGQIQ